MWHLRLWQPAACSLTAELSGGQKCPVSSPLCCQLSLCLGSLRHPMSLGHMAGEEGPAVGFLCKSLSSRGAAAGDKTARWCWCQGDGDAQPTAALVKTLWPSFPFLDITGHIPSLTLQGPAKDVALCPRWHEKTSCWVQAALVSPKPSCPSMCSSQKIAIVVGRLRTVQLLTLFPNCLFSSGGFQAWFLYFGWVKTILSNTPRSGLNCGLNLVAQTCAWPWS